MSYYIIIMSKQLKKSSKITDFIIEEEIPTNTSHIDIENIDGLTYLQKIETNSIDLILTDPPYIISKDSGMNEHYNNVKFNEENNINFVKTDDEWEQYKIENNIISDENKEKYIKYGTIYGKKYCVKTDYGDWDNDFTINTLEQIITQYYRVLKKRWNINYIL
jgi:site-specific DNA-adenine methylase